MMIIIQILIYHRHNSFLDMVLMLKDKTSGNLSEELDKIQNMMLAELESKFVKKLKDLKIMDQPNNSISPFKDKKSRKIILLLSILLVSIMIFIIIKENQYKGT